MLALSYAYATHRTISRKIELQRRMRTKLLFVCSYNACRSPTAEALFQHLKGYEAKSAGICEVAPQRVTRELLAWADLVFVMEDLHKKAILEIMPEVRNKIRVLRIPDKYSYGSSELTRLLIENLEWHGILIPLLELPRAFLSSMKADILRRKRISLRTLLRRAYIILICTTA